MEESDLPNTGGEGCMRPPGPSTGGGGGGPLRGSCVEGQVQGC